MKIGQHQWTAENGWVPPLACGTLGDSAAVVFLFGGEELANAPHGLREVRTVYPNAHVFGCTGCSEIQDTRVRENTLALTAVAFDHTRVAAACAPIPGFDRSFDAGQQLARQFAPEGLRHVFVLSEGLKADASDLVRGINSALPGGATVSGGFAGDGDRFRRTRVWCDGDPLDSSVVALGFYGDRLKVGLAATGAWGPFGPDRLITRSRNNVLYEFDGRPALALYKLYLGEYARGLPASGLMFPLELRTPGSQHRVLRALLSVNEEDQSISFAGDVPEGSYTRLMVGHIEDLIDSSAEGAQISLADLGAAQAQLSILVSCNGRKMVLKQRVEEEVDVVREVFGPQTALTGFYSYGEIGPVKGGGTAELHNETMTITSFTEI